MGGGGGAERTRFLFASPPTKTVTGDWGRRGAWHAEAMEMGVWAERESFEREGDATERRNLKKMRYGAKTLFS